ncbi:Polynucleotide adenylyltransferase family protein [Forsythia ovata]|uniref:Polynucleotide adenylyltransferase family protein n=1 Tax=Forsythia ovata TaxID=205694 RepID=A0ABD1UAN0_9LAMI
MALRQPAKGKPLLYTRKPFLILQRFKATFIEDGRQPQSSADMGRDNFSKWRKLDSRSLGITKSMISLSSWVVLKILQSAGFEAYLVGGCVRDLLLNKVPKDFDVITTAGLKQIRKKFHRAVIVGRRFPICRVCVKGSIVEVSSFQTVAEQSKRKEVFISQMPAGCNQRDLDRWKNCMQRDFTINCLFFDPFVNRIFDYTNAMMDLRSLKLQTVIPAHLSFKEDRARILRGLRLAARLNFSFSEETEAAIYNLSSSIAGLEKSRALLELNYMLSYGAAEPSLLLLKKFKLLEIFLPRHALYLANQAGKQPGLRSSMLMKLFFNLDQLITCDRPCDASLWVALLVFHLALINNPQHAVVVLTLASVLYHGKWKDSVKFAREHAPYACIYTPEVLDASNFLSDDEIAERSHAICSASAKFCRSFS